MSDDDTKVEHVEEKNKKRYYFFPKYCQVCGIQLPYEKRHYTTCSIQCSKLLCNKLMWAGVVL